MDHKEMLASDGFQADDLTVTDRETREWLRDLDNFGRPPPQRHFKTDSLQRIGRSVSTAPVNTCRSTGSHQQRQSADDFVLGSANDPEFLDIVRKFQVSNNHPYNKEHIATSRRIASNGRVSASELASRRVKEHISKEEIDRMTAEVKRINRPNNPWAEPKSTIKLAPSSSNSRQKTNENDTSSAYSSYSSVADESNNVFSANKATLSQHQPKKMTRFTNFSTTAPDYGLRHSSNRTTPVRNANSTGIRSQSVDNRAIDGVFHAKPLMIGTLEKFKRSPVRGIIIDRIPADMKTSTTYTNSFTPKLINELCPPKIIGSSSSSNLTMNRSPTASSDNSSSNMVPTWRLSAHSKPRSNSSQEALETQQRMFERLQQEVEQEMAEDTNVYGICDSCHHPVNNPKEATQAQGRLYHSRCFTCFECNRALKGKHFYEVNGKIYCEEDYLFSGFQQSAERCSVCNHLIIDMVLHAIDQSFHPSCFRCEVCKLCLDGIPFAADTRGKVYCKSDYDRLFSPKCAACNQPILPSQDSGETVRVVAINGEYHIACYVCESCGLQLTDEPDRRCFPLGSHLLCQRCHFHWMKTGGPDPPITDL